MTAKKKTVKKMLQTITLLKEKSQRFDSLAQGADLEVLKRLESLDGAGVCAINITSLPLFCYTNFFYRFYGLLPC